MLRTVMLIAGDVATNLYQSEFSPWASGGAVQWHANAGSETSDVARRVSAITLVFVETNSANAQSSLHAASEQLLAAEFGVPPNAEHFD